MDPPTLDTHLTDLSTNISSLTTSLTPLLRTPLHTTASTLPLLDKAKLYIHLSYTIESLLYSSLLTAGIDAKSHPVFAELARLKTYFQKLKAAELGPEEEKKRLGVDLGAAGRFIKAGLAGNDKYDKEKAERVAKEKARAAIQARKLVNKKFDDKDESAKLAAVPSLRKASEDQDESSNENVDVEAENAELYGGDEDEDADMNEAYDQEASASPSTSTNKPSKSKKDRTKKAGRRDESGKVKSREEMRAERREKKLQRRAERSEEVADKAEKEPETVLPAKQAPKSHSETFKALLEGPIKKESGKKSKSKGKGKK